jgi:hypothetical protein
MTARAYGAAWCCAGRFACPPIPRCFSLTRGIPAALPACANAVYVATDLGGDVRYVGSTTRTSPVRLAAHARDVRRATEWSHLWIVPLVDDLPRRVVLDIEGRVGRLLKPTDNMRLPRV